MAASGIVWRNGDLNKMAFEIQLRGQKLDADMAQAVATTVNEAEAEMRQIIEAAHTEAGRKRVAKGGAGPGRTKTGLMINSTNSRTTHNEDSIVGEWGWLNTQEDYFLFQENGTGGQGSGGGIKAMHSIYQSFIHARESLAQRINALARGKSGA